MTGEFDMNILITTSNKNVLEYFPIEPEGEKWNEASTAEPHQQNINRFVFNLHVIIRVIVRAAAIPFIFSVSHPANENIFL